MEKCFREPKVSLMSWDCEAVSRRVSLSMASVPSASRFSHIFSRESSYTEAIPLISRNSWRLLVWVSR